MPRKKATYKEMMDYLDQISLRIENNQRAVYDLSQVFSDYVEMHKDGTRLNDYMKEKHSSDDSGLDAGIPTHWSVFCKFFKNSYLKLKKILAFKK